MKLHVALTILDHEVHHKINTAESHRALHTVRTHVDALLLQRSAFLELLAGLGVPDPASYLAHDPAVLRDLGRCIFEKASGSNPERIAAVDRLGGRGVSSGA